MKNQEIPVKCGVYMCGGRGGLRQGYVLKLILGNISEEGLRPLHLVCENLACLVSVTISSRKPLRLYAKCF